MTAVERVAAVTAWWETTYPGRPLSPDPAVWGRALTAAASGPEVTAALTRWRQTHPEAPTPADCNAQIRQIAANRAAGTHIARARQQIAEAIARRDAERPHTRPRQPLGGTR